MQDQTQTTLDEVVTPDSLVKQHPDKFTKPQITWLLRNRHRNGLEKSGAVSMVGRKFYINTPKFTTWLLSQNS
ncbi:MAG: hypothetical protein Q7U57_07630 [Methylovulum sp.]|nr:hypothetical protein [Methylovulum sp.]